MNISFDKSGADQTSSFHRRQPSLRRLSSSLAKVLRGLLGRTPEWPPTECRRRRFVQRGDSTLSNWPRKKTMSRKVVKCGYLYVAPPNVDFTNAAQRTRRWQRRWFALYDDGELSYALDQHADTVPQGVVDMTTCVNVRCVDDYTGHNHSLRITTSSDEQLYFKADSAEEINWWREVVCVYAKRSGENNVSTMGTNAKCLEKQPSSPATGITLVRVKSPADRSQRRTSDPLSQAKVDISRNDSFHGTPRSVKNRKTTRCKDERSKTFGEFSINNDLNFAPTDGWTVSLRAAKTSKRDESPNPPIIHTSLLVEQSDIRIPEVQRLTVNNTDKVLPVKPGESAPIDKKEENNTNDNSSSHTLRKGWLMLKGRSETDWTKHWVVLAGPSLKTYKDAWAEDDCADASVKIDLTDCVSVLPITVSKNYGIEIKCKHSRHVFSAMTPGIRDSWIVAIQQNLIGNNSFSDSSSVVSSLSGSTQNSAQKKRIAYVAPESHRRDAECESDSNSDDEELNSLRSNSRNDDTSISGRSLESVHDAQSDDGGSAACSGTSTPRRRRSLSPTVRRSPVSRVKERDTSRRQRSPVTALTGRSRDKASAAVNNTESVTGSSFISDSEKTSTLERRRGETNDVVMLQNQLASVRENLERARNRLSNENRTNERIARLDDEDTGGSNRILSGGSEVELERLRKMLREAECDIWRKQEEIEALTQKLDYSPMEINETETPQTSDAQSSDKADRVGTFQSLDSQVSAVTGNEPTRQSVSTTALENQQVFRQKNQELIEHQDWKADEISRRPFPAEESLATAAQTSDCCAGKEWREEAVQAENLSHFYHDQTRRLLATLKNDTEFLQKLVDSKLDSLSKSECWQSIWSELNELADDLILVHQYISEIDRSVSDFSPEAFSKGFNFKDVLNRLVEAQERFAELDRREDEAIMNMNSTTESYKSDLRALHEQLECLTSQLHDCRSQAASTSSTNASSVGNVLPEKSDQRKTPFSAIPTWWDYTVSPFHDDLARSLTTFIDSKYEDLSRRPVLTSNDMATILSEAMSVEACLVTEIANVIEAGSDEFHLETVLMLKDTRSVYVSLRELANSLEQNSGDRQLSCLAGSDANFSILCGNTSRYVLSELQSLIETIPPKYQKRLTFEAGEDNKRSLALAKLAKVLMRDVSCDNDANGQLQILRSSILKEEIAGMLARLENQVPTAEDRQNNENRLTMISTAFQSAIRLRDRLLEKTDRFIEEIIVDSASTNKAGLVEWPDAEQLLQKQWNNTMVTSRLNRSGMNVANANSHAKLVQMERAFADELSVCRLVLAQKFVRLKDLCRLGNIFCGRGMIRGLCSWLQTSFETFCAKNNFSPLLSDQNSTDDAMILADSVATSLDNNAQRQRLVAGLRLDECVIHYEPLTKRLFYQCCSSIVAKLTTILVSISYETEILNGRNSDVQTYDKHPASETVWIKSLPPDTGPIQPPVQVELGHFKRAALCGDGNAASNLADEVAELEQELFEMQSSHNEELESLRAFYGKEIETLKRELTLEQERRRKLYSDMESMKNFNDHSLAALKNAHAQLIVDLRDEHQRRVEQLIVEQEQTLSEEKDATRHAIDALQKAHEQELKRQAEKLKDTITRGGGVGDSDTDTRSISRRYDLQQSLQQMSKEIADLSTAYSDKCLESTRLNNELEEVQRTLQRENNSYLAESNSGTDNGVCDATASVGRLQSELRLKDVDLRRCQERIRQLESDLIQTRASIAFKKALDNGDGSSENSDTKANAPSSEESCEDDNIASEYQPKTARQRRSGLPNGRRGDNRYHSSPNLKSQSDDSRSSAPDRILLELRNAIGLPVSERRKFFEKFSSKSCV